LGFGGPGRKALVFEPTYSLHSLIPRITGTEVVSADRAGDFSVDPGRAAEAVDRNTPDLVIFCSPNNPTGAVERRDAIEAVLDVAPGLVVVDEAYAEFGEPEESVRDLLDTRSNLVLTKTFSKAWRLAGVRIGYMLGDPALIAELARVRLPYHLSTLTQAVGEAALKHAGATLELVNSIKHERERIGKGLEALDLRAWPSSANFVLFEVDEPERVFNGLLEREVLVRRYGSVPQLERCLRVTAGLPEETDAFLAALEEVCRG
jgi:histidinol-phosphate aminotransferase